MTATIWTMPTEPPVGTRVRDTRDNVWTRTKEVTFGWENPNHVTFHSWYEIHEHGPLTKVSALPTEPRTIIRATGADAGEPFEDEVLIRDYEGYWRGATATLSPIYHPGDRIDTFTVLDTYDPETQAVVPRKEYEALLEAQSDRDYVRVYDAAATLTRATEEEER